VTPVAPVASVIKTILKWSYSADADVLCRFFHEYAGTAPDDAQLNTFASAVATAWDSDMAAQFNTDVTLDQVNVIDLTSDTAARGEAIVSYAGTLAGDTLSAGTCALENIQIRRAYRGGKPRIYWPAGSAASLGAATAWGSTFTTAFPTALAAFYAAVAAAGWSGSGGLSRVNVSYSSGYTLGPAQPGGYRKKIATPRVGGPVVDPITGFTLNTKPASQRRRNLHKS
jgi:hypothetical protein